MLKILINIFPKKKESVKKLISSFEKHTDIELNYFFREVYHFYNKNTTKENFNHVVFTSCIFIRKNYLEYEMLEKSEQNYLKCIYLGFFKHMFNYFLKISYDDIIVNYENILNLLFSIFYKFYYNLEKKNALYAGSLSYGLFNSPNKVESRLHLVQIVFLYTQKINVKPKSFVNLFFNYELLSNKEKNEWWMSAIKYPDILNTSFIMKILKNKNKKIFQVEMIIQETEIIHQKDINQDKFIEKIIQVNETKISNDKYCDDQIRNDKYCNDQISDDQINNYQISDDKISDNKYCNDKISDDKISDDQNEIDSNKKNEISINKNEFISNTNVKNNNEHNFTISEIIGNKSEIDNYEYKINETEISKNEIKSNISFDFCFDSNIFNDDIFSDTQNYVGNFSDNGIFIYERCIDQSDEEITDNNNKSICQGKIFDKNDSLENENSSVEKKFNICQSNVSALNIDKLMKTYLQINKTYSKKELTQQCEILCFQNELNIDYEILSKKELIEILLKHLL